jgi:hypothetical protein
MKSPEKLANPSLAALNRVFRSGLILRIFRKTDPFDPHRSIDSFDRPPNCPKPTVVGQPAGETKNPSGGEWRAQDPAPIAGWRGALGRVEWVESRWPSLGLLGQPSAGHISNYGATFRSSAFGSQRIRQRPIAVVAFGCYFRGDPGSG